MDIMYDLWNIATDTAKMTISSLAVIIIYLRLVIDMNMCTIILYPPYPPCNGPMYKSNPNLSNLTDGI